MLHKIKPTSSAWTTRLVNQFFARCPSKTRIIFKGLVIFTQRSNANPLSCFMLTNSAVVPHPSPESPVSKCKGSRIESLVAIALPTSRTWWLPTPLARHSILATPVTITLWKVDLQRALAWLRKITSSALLWGYPAPRRPSDSSLVVQVSATVPWISPIISLLLNSNKISGQPRTGPTASHSQACKTWMLREASSNWCSQAPSTLWRSTSSLNEWWFLGSYLDKRLPVVKPPPLAPSSLLTKRTPA